MAQIDLPGYLKHSRFLNNLSVRRILQYWAVICAGAVFLLSLTALITNDIISARQKLLDTVYIPAANLVRNLERDFTRLDEQNRPPGAVNTIDEAGVPPVEVASKQQVNRYLQDLSVIVSGTGDMKYLVQPLVSGFADYFNPAGGNEAASRSTELQQTSAELHAMLDRLKTIIGDKTRTLSAQTYDLSQLNLFIIVAISLIVIAVIIAGISLVIFRIDQPLDRLSEAMHDLSSGNLSRRMEASHTVKDEFAVLAEDFNRFAERNQALFNEVSDARDALADSEKRTRAILENALVGIVYVRQQEVIDINQKFLELFGYQRDEVLGENIERFYASKADIKTMKSSVMDLLNSGNTYKGEWQMQHHNGNLFWCAVSAKSLSPDSTDKGVIWLFEDITQRKNQEAELLKMTNYDSLTGLPNRSLFMDRLQQGLNRSGRSNRFLGLLYIDLDRFKVINDSLGHSIGDELLIEVAGLISECVRSSDTVSRLGGDEFTIVLPELIDISDAGKVAEKVINVLATPCKLQAHEIGTSPSIGISIYPGDAGDIETLLKNAESAMYHAKSMGRNNYQYYTREMNALARERLDRENKLRKAIDADQFRLYYQPQVDVESMKITGYEALIRWQENSEKLVSPDQFVPLLEDTGLIIPVGEWILYRACHDIPELSRRNDHFQSVSVNLSARQFIDDSIARRIIGITSECGISPDKIVIEITESLMMTESQRSLRILTELSNNGFRLSLDDFGTGYSSLAYLRQFPIDVIKIDQSFVQGLLANRSDATICEAIITIARQLQMKVVAEGVETAEQFNYMRKNGCHSIQGFYFGKPAPLENILCVIS